MVAPPTGTHDVVITFSADLYRYAVAGVITFSGVNQTTPLGSFAGNFATSNAASVTIPAATNDLALGVISCETCTSVTFVSPAVERWNLAAGSGNNEFGAGATDAGASPQTTISASLGSSDHWAMGGVAIKPVPTGGPTPTQTATSTATPTPTPTNAASSLDVRVASGSDDVEQRVSDGFMSILDSTDLELVVDGTNTSLYGRGWIVEQQPGGFVVHSG